MEDPNKKTNIFERKSTHWLVIALLIIGVMCILAEFNKKYSIMWVYYLIMVLFAIAMICMTISFIYVFKERIRGDY